MMQRRFVRLAIALFAVMGSLVSAPDLAYASSDLADEWKLVRGKKFNCQRNGQIYIYNNKLSPLYTHNQALIEAGAEKFAPKFIEQCPSMESLTVFASSGPMSIGYVRLLKSNGWTTPSSRQPGSGRTRKAVEAEEYRRDLHAKSGDRRYLRQKQEENQFRCFHLAGRVKANINRAYVTDAGRAYLKPPETNFTTTPYLNSVGCGQETMHRLDNHRVVMTNHFPTSFIGRNPGKPVHTFYDVTMTTSPCVDVPKLHFFTRSVTSNHNHTLEHPVLRNFFIYQSKYWGRYADRLYTIRKFQCPEVSQDNLYPEQIRVHIYDDGNNQGQPDTKYTKYLDDPEGPFKLLYSGIFITDSWAEVRWYDDLPTDRYEYTVREQEYQAWLRRRFEQREAERDAFWTGVAAAVIGYAQGRSFELLDEGACSFLAMTDDFEVNRRQYETCHNTLYQMYENLQADAPQTYLVFNMLGMMSTSFDEFLGESKTREGEAMRVGVAEYMECAFTERNSRSLDNPATAEELAEICGKWGVFGAGKGYLTGPSKSN